MTRRYLTLCTECDWHTNLLDDPAEGTKAYKAHPCKPRVPKKKPAEPAPAPPPAPSSAPETSRPSPTPATPPTRPALPPAGGTFTLDKDRPTPTWNRIQLDDLDPEMPWQTAALCAQIEPDAWFPAKGQNVSPTVKRVCLRCPVREPCLDVGIRSRDQYGIYGGLTYRERRKLPRWRDFDDEHSGDEHRSSA